MIKFRNKRKINRFCIHFVFNKQDSFSQTGVQMNVRDNWLGVHKMLVIGRFHSQQKIDSPAPLPVDCWILRLHIDDITRRTLRPRYRVFMTPFATWSDINKGLTLAPPTRYYYTLCYYTFLLKLSHGLHNYWQVSFVY